MKREYGATVIGGVLLGLSGLLCWLFSFFGVSPLDFYKFILGVLVVAYVPGQALCWLARLESSRLEMLNLALVVGLVTSTVVYKLARLLDVLAMFFLWLCLAAGVFIWKLIKHPPKREDFSFRITATGALFIGLALLLLLTLVVDNYRNGLERTDGSVVINAHYYDGFIRNAVVRELTHSVPPQMPFAAGFPIGYHYGMDLFLAMFYRHLGLGVLDLIHRFSLTWFLLLFISSMFIFVRELSTSSGAALLASFLAVFGSGGFAYLATYLLGIYQWGDIFHSFYYFNFVGINSLLPAFVVLLTGFYALSRALKTRQPGWAWIAALLLALSLEYKLFLVGPVVGALVLAGGLVLLFQGDRMLLKVLMFTLILAAPLVLFAYFSSHGSPQYTFRLHFVDWVRWSLQELHLTPLQRAWADLVHRSLFTPRTLLAVIPALLVFFVGGMGVYILAVPSLLKEFFFLRRISPLRSFLIALLAGSVLYIFCVDMSLQGKSCNLVYVYKLGLVLLCALFAERVFLWTGSHSRTVVVLSLLLVVAMSVPNTARFIWIRVQTPNPHVYPADFMETCDWINRHTEPEATFLHPLELKNACYFMDRRVVLDDTGFSFLDWHLPPEERRKRRDDATRYFSDFQLNSDVLDRYSVRYVWGVGGALAETLRDPQGWIDAYIDLGTKRPRKARHSHQLEIVWSQGEHVLLRVHPVPEAERSVYILEESEGKRVFKKFQPLQEAP